MVSKHRQVAVTGISRPVALDDHDVGKLEGVVIAVVAVDATAVAFCQVTGDDNVFEIQLVVGVDAGTYRSVVLLDLGSAIAHDMRVLVGVDAAAFLTGGVVVDAGVAGEIDLGVRIVVDDAAAVLRRSVAADIRAVFERDRSVVIEVYAAAPRVGEVAVDTAAASEGIGRLAVVVVDAGSVSVERFVGVDQRARLQGDAATRGIVIDAAAALSGGVAVDLGVVEQHRGAVVVHKEAAALVGLVALDRRLVFERELCHVVEIDAAAIGHSGVVLDRGLAKGELGAVEVIVQAATASRGVVALYGHAARKLHRSFSAAVIDAAAIANAAVVRDGAVVLDHQLAVCVIKVNAACALIGIVVVYVATLAYLKRRAGGVVHRNATAFALCVVVDDIGVLELELGVIAAQADAATMTEAVRKRIGHVAGDRRVGDGDRHVVTPGSNAAAAREAVVFQARVCCAAADQAALDHRGAVVVQQPEMPVVC